MQKAVLYLAIDVFQKGGIQRYSKAQINSLIKIFGEERVQVSSLYSPLDSELLFEDPPEFPVHTNNKKYAFQVFKRLHYMFNTLVLGFRVRPAYIWVNHIKLFPFAMLLKTLYGSRVVMGNVYGLEVWSGVSWLERWSLQRLNGIVSDCHFTKNYVCQDFHVPQEKVTVIWDPVDTEKFIIYQVDPTAVFEKFRLTYQKGLCYLMTLGRISKASMHKGYDRIIDALNNMDTRDIRYVIGGDGDELEPLIKRTGEKGMSDRVVFFGDIPEADLVDMYNSIDVFILVSDKGKGRGEGVPLTPLEAAACGKPIIVGNADGSSEAVEDHKNGLIVDPHNQAEIIEAIRSLADDPEARRRMGEAARQHIEDNFSFQVFHNKHERLLSGMLSENQYNK